MPSRADLRRRIEWILRAIVIGSLAFMLWRSVMPSSSASIPAAQSSQISATALATWSAEPLPPRIDLQIDAVPSRTARAWLSGLAGAGSSITWTGTPSAVMTSVEPIPAPTGGVRVLIAAPSTATVVLSDDVGPIDSITPVSHGASVSLAGSHSRIAASSAGTTATSNAPDSIILRKVLVLGSASWETKFATGALEEEGWKVDAIIRVAPGVTVGPASLPLLDTSRYSAVVAIDSAAAAYASRITEFVRNGGGLVLAPDAAAYDAFAQLRAGTVASTNGESVLANPAITLATLPVRPMTSLRADAVPLQRTRGGVSLAARRFTAGRVVQLGIADTWRLRMRAGDDGVREHRQLWTRLVSDVAYAPHVRAKDADINADAAPLADLVTAIGPARTKTGARGISRAQTDWILWLFVLFAAGLLGEVASRRLRGAP